ncbi:OmpP1/FadL family transporter [Chryseobacterium oryctis]|uniref:Outer membrane protein transport protein n=1 Tax=Chryseobacterium oryctis TaxID=2952618 RepID=A0ABT3HN93_9FLAO|nr:outer membrane protein transport protein [Chryseobacterium oryctis]MCW3161198.1 outer membrane protein transport protein [Chryseobacterium oryctis]
MLKKSLVLMSISAAFFAQAQDVSIIRNSIEMYSGSPMVGSSKFNAMGGANGALGGDASSLLTNPAGLGVAISGEVSGTLSISNYKNTSTLGNSSLGYNKTQGDIGNIGAVMTFQLLSESAWKFVNIGVNFSNQSLDNYIETPGNTNIIYDFDIANNDSSSFGGHAYNRTGYLSKTSVGVGANYNNSLYIGAGLNFLNASIDQYDTARFNSTANGASELFDKNETPFSERSNGFSASLGVIGKVGPMFRLGASIETPTFWNIDRGYNFYNDSVYGDGSAVEDRRLTSPLKASVSAAFVPNKNFSLDVDYTLGLTKPKYKEYSGADVEINNFFKDNYKNLSELRIGAEYRLKQLRLRGGYAYASSPIDALTVSKFNNDGTASDQSYSNLILSDRNALSFGLGYDFKSFYIDATYQNISSKYTNPFMYGILDTNNGINSAYYSSTRTIESGSYIVSDVKSNRNNFFITFGWKF